MRLIEGDALARIFRAKSDMAMGTLKIAFANAEKMVELMPTIEAEPVKHGMTHERLLLSIQTVKENIVILENVEPEDAGCYLQLEHERHILELLEAEAEGRLFVLPRKMDLEGE